jgi:putative hydrolase
MTGSFGFGPNNDAGDENEPRIPNLADLFGNLNNLAGLNNFGDLNNFAQAANSAGQESILPIAIVRDVARKFLATQSEIPVGLGDIAQSEEALTIANTWLDGVTIFPATSHVANNSWSRRDWLDSSVAGWQKMVEPLANGMAEALTHGLPALDQLDQLDQLEQLEQLDLGGMQLPNMAAMVPMMRNFVGILFATQLGQAVGQLAFSVTGAHDVALPIFQSAEARLLPQNIAVWGAGLELPAEEIRIYLALREAAAARLFSHTPWLAGYIREAIAAYGSGIRIDIQAVQRQAEDAVNSGELDLTNPESINIAITRGMFTPEQTPKQEASLNKLEMVLALIDGWIDYVTSQAAESRLPSFAALSEALRRQRATSAPTQQLFASLLGLQVSPRKTRECVAFWGEVTRLAEAKGRDNRWEDSVLLPTSDDLGDAAKFLASTTVPDDLSGLI